MFKKKPPTSLSRLISLQQQYDQSVAAGTPSKTWQLWYEIMALEDKMEQAGEEIPLVAVRRMEYSGGGMTTIPFPAATHVFTAPADWDSAQHGPCADLHVEVADNVLPHAGSQAVRRYGRFWAALRSC